MLGDGTSGAGRLEASPMVGSRQLGLTLGAVAIEERLLRYSISLRDGGMLGRLGTAHLGAGRKILDAEIFRFREGSLTRRGRSLSFLSSLRSCF